MKTISQFVTTLITPRRPHMMAIIACSTAFAAGAFLQVANAAEEAWVIPAPIMDEKTTAKTETAVFAGGCFWGVQGVFQHVKGVKSAVSGYAGGAASTAQYEAVSGGDTGHAESVKVTFDPSEVTYGELLQIYFSVVHNPTELNYQGPDHGTQYRSTVFSQNDEQAKITSAYIRQLDTAKIYDSPIVTIIEKGKTFYPAEDYHQDFLIKNLTYPYIVVNDLPKIENLKRMFASKYQSDPILAHR
jgi:peptide-methionine (S)-S-oxide reductase